MPSVAVAVVAVAAAAAIVVAAVAVAASPAAVAPAPVSPAPPAVPVLLSAVLAHRPAALALLPDLHSALLRILLPASLTSLVLLVPAISEVPRRTTLVADAAVADQVASLGMTHPPMSPARAASPPKDAAARQACQPPGVAMPPAPPMHSSAMAAPAAHPPKSAAAAPIPILTPTLRPTSCTPITTTWCTVTNFIGIPVLPATSTGQDSGSIATATGMTTT